MCKTSSKTFLINEWAKDDHQYITLSFVFASDDEIYNYTLEYWDSRYSTSMVSRIKNKNKQKNDDSDKY